MITFKEFLSASLIVEDVFADGDTLKAAVNSDTTRRSSTPTSISTNLRPLGKQTGTTRGVDVYYAFSYKPSKDTAGSSDLLNSFKGKGPLKFTVKQRQKFLNDATTHMASEFKKLNKIPDVIVTPQSSTSTVSDFANMLADKLGVHARKIGAFKKSSPIELPDNKQEALELIKRKYVDYDYIEQVFKGDESQKDSTANEIAKTIYKQIKETGKLEVKHLYKVTAKFVKNIFDSSLEGDDEYSLMDKDVMVIDDILSSGATMSDLFRAVKDLGAANVYGATLFARTTSTKKD